MDNFSNKKLRNEFINSDQIIKQSATKLSMVQVVIDENHRFIKTHAKPMLTCIKMASDRASLLYLERL